MKTAPLLILSFLLIVLLAVNAYDPERKVLQGGLKVLATLLSDPDLVKNNNYFKESDHVALADSSLNVVETKEPKLKVDIPRISNANNDHKQYVEIVNSCGPFFVGSCITAHTGPSNSYPIAGQLRSGVILEVAETVAGEDGKNWHRIKFDEYLFYPWRVNSDWYVEDSVVRNFYNAGYEELTENSVPVDNKEIIVDLNKQKLYAYENDVLFMTSTVSTGLSFTPTPIGIFKILRKTPSRYMQGPLPGFSDDQYYDLPGVPWVMYFTEDGAAIHGTYWHDKFGQRWSHGCVNLSVEEAEIIYKWADIGTKVIVIN